MEASFLGSARGAICSRTCGGKCHEKTARHRHTRYSRRAIPGPIDRSDHDADLPDVDIRPAKPWKAQRLRLLTLDQSNTERLRTLHSQSRKRNARLEIG